MSEIDNVKRLTKKKFHIDFAIYTVLYILYISLLYIGDRTQNMFLGCQIAF